VSGEPLPIGSTGEIVVTTLESGWPLIRFGTGDVAQALSQADDGLVDRIGLLQGRVGQGVKVREVFVYPRNIEEVLSRVPALSRVQLVVEAQGHRETMTLRAELKPTGIPADVEDHLMDSFKQVTRLKLDNIEWLEIGQLAEGDPTLVDRKHAKA
jgi:phenylacetate-CoA ligase